MVSNVDNSETGCRVQVRVRHGATYRQESAFARRLTDYLDEHEIQHSGGPLLMWLTGQDRELCATDQIDLAFWLLQDDTCSGLRISDLGVLGGEHGFLDLDALDVSVLALMLLYWQHRLSPSQVIDILGGFVRRTDPEEGM